MQSTGHSSMQALSFRSTQGWAMMYVTAFPIDGGARLAPYRCWGLPRPRLVSRCRSAEPTGGGPVSSSSVPRGSDAPRPAGGRGPVALLTVRVGPADVGRRVSLRHRLADGSGATDLVGRLTSWDLVGGDLRVVRRSGDEVVVPSAALLGGHVVAPEWGAYELQVVAQGGWRPRERADLDGWEARWTDGVTGRANSVRVGADPDVDLPRRLDEVRAWYGARGSGPLLQSPSPSVWDRDLEALGWGVVRRTLMLTARTAEVLDACARRPGPDATGITAGPDLSPAWAAAMDEPQHEHATIVEILRRTPVARYAAVLDEGGAALAIARAAVSTGPGRRAQERWSQVTSVHTLAHARGLGLATALMSDLASWSLAQGAPRILLQTLATNAPAIALYRGMGFAVHHAYVYRAPHDAGPVRP